MDALHTPATDRLFEALLRLSTVEECYALFEDLCTIREVRDLSYMQALKEELANIQDDARKSESIARENARLRELLNLKDALDGAEDHPIERKQHHQRPDGQKGIDHTVFHPASQLCGPLQFFVVDLVIHSITLTHSGHASC